MKNEIVEKVEEVFENCREMGITDLRAVRMLVLRTIKEVQDGSPDALVAEKVQSNRLG